MMKDNRDLIEEKEDENKKNDILEDIDNEGLNVLRMQSMSNNPVDDKIEYPIKKFIPLPILNSENSEVVLLYIPEFEIDNFLEKVDFKPNQVLESDKILSGLEEYVKDYIIRSINEYGLEKRVENSYNTMEKLNTQCSLVLKMSNDFKNKPIIVKYLEMFKDVKENIDNRINITSALNFFHKYGSLISQFRNFNRKTFMKKVIDTGKAYVKKKVIVYKNRLKNKLKSKINNFSNKLTSKVKKNFNKVKNAANEKLGDITSNGMKKFKKMKNQIKSQIKTINIIEKAVEEKKEFIRKEKANINELVKTNEYRTKISMENFHEDSKKANSENAHSKTQENNSIKNIENNSHSVVAVASENQVKKVEEKKPQQTNVEDVDGFSYKDILESIFIKHQTNFKKDLMLECVYMEYEIHNNEYDSLQTHEHVEEDDRVEEDIQNEEEEEEEKICESSINGREETSPNYIEYFEDKDFEKFVIYIEIFVNLFTGIQVKYFIDELGFLNMDFYSSEDNLMTLAELMHYQLQFRIMNTTIKLPYKKEKSESEFNEEELNEKIQNNTIENFTGEQNVELNLKADLTESLINSNEKSNILCPQLGPNTLNNSIPLNDKEIFKINKKKYEELDIDDVSLFPPFANFSKQNAQFFRRYDIKDDYHICEECDINKLKTHKDCLKLECSSIFREIDKTRIITNNLSSLINMNIVTNPNGDDSYMKEILNKFLILHDYNDLEETTEFTDFLKGYLIPYENKITKETNKVWRNTFGEDVGIYFTWVTHYLSWLVFPAFIGIIHYLLGKYYLVNSEWNMFLYFSLFLSGFVIIWANLYLTSWKSREEFLLHTWGMKSFKLDKSNEIEDVAVDKTVFMGIKMPIISAYRYFLRRTFSAIIIFLSLCTTMFLNLLIFYMETSHTTTMNRGAWAFITPICSFLIRENMSSIYKEIAISLTNIEYHIHKPDYNASLKIKIIFFEFFNYYFNLYYIAFVKPFSNPTANCYNELGTQLTGILISAITVDFTKLFWNAVYLKKKTKEFEKTLRENNPSVNNSSSKFIYYTRTEYESADVNGEFLDIILNYGYIIQFGASSPICFFIALLQTVAMRFMDSIKFSKLQYCKLISNSNGIGVYYKVMKLMNFLGLITNVCIIIFTNPIIASNLEFSKKMMMIIIIENFIIVFNMLSKGKSFPLWFKFKDQVDMLYLKKYGNRVNKEDKKKKKK